MLSDTTLKKGVRLYRTGRVVKDGDGFTVRGDHGTYRIHITDGGTCNCPARGRCSHIEAAYLEIRYGELRKAEVRGRARTTDYDDNHQETTT